jgi:hypothetical protein
MTAGLIAERVFRSKSLTSYSETEKDSAPVIPHFSVTRAIEEHVAKEDLMQWGRRSEPVFQTIAPLKEVGEATPFEVFHFVKGFLP